MYRWGLSMTFRVLRSLGFGVGVVLCGLSSQGAEDLSVGDASRLEPYCGQFQQELASRLKDLADVAQALFGAAPASGEARGLLDRWSSNRLDWAEIALLETDGRVVVRKRRGGSAQFVADGMGTGQFDRERLKAGQPTTRVIPSGGKDGVWCHTLFPLFDAEGAWAGAVRLTYRFGNVFSKTLQALSLGDGERFVAISREGRILFSEPWHSEPGISDTYLALSARPSRQALFERIQHEEGGVGAYPALKEAPPQTMLRRVEWMRCGFMNARWILVVETEEDLPQDPDNPITGRWVGAYTIQGAERAPGERGKELFPRGGQLNVVILQDGHSCTLRAIGEEGDHMANGVVISDRFSAAHIELSRRGKVAVWYWEGFYDPGKDAIKGSIRGNAADVATTQSFFLRRVELPTRTAVGDSAGRVRRSTP